MLDFLLSIILFIIGLALGFYLLLLGRRTMALTTAIICLTGTGRLLSLIFLNENGAWAIAESRDWLLIGMTVAAGIIGGILGARAERIAVNVVGFFAGGYMGLWFYDIAHQLVVNIAHWPEQTVFWVGVAILAVGGLLGLYFTRRSEAVTVILISAFVGTDLIGGVLNLDPAKSTTAVILISLALLGLVVQYAQYMRELKVERLTLFAETGPAPAPEYFDLSDDRR
jgi:hypothetical protein